jgi:TP901 family phage tail tape measure protein
VDKEVKIGLILSAYDKASEVLDKFFGKNKKNIADLKTAAVDVGKGMALWKMGREGFSLLDGPLEAFGKMEAAGNDLKGALMGPGGVLDENTYKKITKLSMDLSDQYKGSATDYLEMVRVLKENRINEADVLGGIGAATAKLSDLFEMAPANIAEFSAHMRNDMGVAVGDMEKVMDLVARVHGSGVGKSGSEAVTEMNEFFSKASLGAANLGVQGLEASKQMGALGALFMSRGLSGATVGTNFRRIFDGLSDATKVAKANAVAGMFGKHLDLYKDGKFLGMDNFVQQLGKLQDLSGAQVAAVLKTFSGKQGLSTDFLQFLSKNGVQGYQEFLQKLDSQAGLTDKLSVKMKGLNYQKEVFNTSTENMKASLAEGFAPTITAIYEIMNSVVGKIREFADEHPKLFKMAAAFVAIASGAMMLMGAIKVMTALTTVMRIFGITTWTAFGPIGIAIGVVIAALAALYAYWDDITAFFKKTDWSAVLMNTLKGIYNAVLGWVMLPLKGVLSLLGWIGKALGLKSLQNAAESANAFTDKLFVSYDKVTKAPAAGSADYARRGLYVPPKGKDGGDAVSGLSPAADRSTVNNAVTVNLSGGATAADGKAVSDSIQTTFDKLMRDHEQRKARRAF